MSLRLRSVIGESALVEQNTSSVEASKFGELDLQGKSLGDKLSVVGRKQTGQIKGVEGKVIKNGIIYLSNKNKSDHHIGNIYVFYFGKKMVMPHDSSTLKAGVSCMSNHGGPNCSNAFGIYKGRCTFNSSVCMDYNGWFTNFWLFLQHDTQC